ncbi:hypothetical protein ACFL56_02655 [Candidatus Margulisiibacteriota bacterium]
MKYIKIITLAVILLSSIHAGEAVDIFYKSAGVRSQGMGNAGIALIAPYAGIYNPAGLFLKNNTQVSFAQNEIRNDIHQSHFLFGFPAGDQRNIAFNYLTIGVDDIDKVRDDGGGNPEVIGTIENRQSMYNLTLQQAFSEKIYGGINLNYFDSSLDEVKGTGIGLDVGVMYRASDAIYIGAVAKNILNSEMQWEDTTDTLPNIYSIGALANTKIFNRNFIIAADYDSDGQYGIGSELEAIKSFFIRAGIHKDKYTAGIGLKFDMLMIDYAYQTHTETALEYNSHIISVGLMFEERNNKNTNVKTLHRNVSQKTLYATSPQQKPSYITSLTITKTTIIQGENKSKIYYRVENTSPHQKTMRITSQINGNTQETYQTYAFDIPPYSERIVMHEIPKEIYSSADVNPQIEIL